MWSPSRIYGPDKAFQMTTLVLWALIAGALIIAPSPERIRRLFTVLLLLALWGGVDAVLAYGETGLRYSIKRDDGEEMGGHLLLGRLTAPGALVALAAWLYNRGRRTSWLYLGLFLALGFVLAIGGGRGALLSTVLPLLIPVGLSIRLTTREIRYWRALLSVLVLLLVAAGGLALYATTTGQRLPTFDRMETAGRRATRAPRATREWAGLWPQAPLLGHGTGSWPLLTGRPDQTSYPHNLFLELLVENGIVGLILFLVVVGVALRPVSFERLRRDPQALCAFMVFISAFSNAMTSGDLPGNRAVFLMLGVLALFAVRPVAAATPVKRHPAASSNVPVSQPSGLTRGQHAAERVQ